MSTQFRFPRNFVRRDDLRLSSGGAIENVEPKSQESAAGQFFGEGPALLRDGHIVLFAIDVLVMLQASFKKWRNHRLTLRALDDLDERQLHDIGVTRDGGEYRTLSGGTK